MALALLSNALKENPFTGMDNSPKSLALELSNECKKYFITVLKNVLGEFALVEYL